MEEGGREGGGRVEAVREVEMEEEMVKLEVRESHIFRRKHYSSIQTDIDQYHLRSYTKHFFLILPFE